MRARALLLAGLLVLPAFTLFAYDFGFVLDNSSSYGNQQTPAFTQKDKLGGWFTSGIGENLTFTGSASAQVWGLSPWFILNLDLLNLKGSFPKPPGGASLFSFTIGRYNESDFTGLVFSGQSIDGFTVGFDYPGLSLTADLGYTGLTLNPLSYIFMTQADVAAQGSSSNYFGSPRILGRLQAFMPGLFLRQDLTLTVLVQQDLRSVFSGSLIQPGSNVLVYGQGGSLDSEYFGAGLSGSIIENLFYKSYLYVETGRTLSYVTSAGSYQYEPILAFLVGGGARYYADSLLHSTFGFDFLFASGDGDYTQAIEGDTSGGYATVFVPVTSPPRLLSLAYSPNVGNIIAATLSYAIRPFADAKDHPELQNLQAIVKAIPFLRPTTGAVGAAVGLAPSAVSPGLSASLANLYLGSEFDLVVSYRPFSDLGVQLQGGVFVPNSNLFLSSAALAYVELDFSMSF